MRIDSSQRTRAKRSAITPSSRYKTPGEPGIWIFVLGDLLVFSTMFASFLLYRQKDVDLFNSASEQLNVPLGIFNTLLLLTSSLFVVFAVKLARSGDRIQARRWIRYAMGFGLAFLVVKGIEYVSKFGDGVILSTNDFYIHYFLLTGIHAVHVIFGLAALSIFFGMTHQRSVGAHDIKVFESVGIYWHMVDLLWIVLFSLFYFLR